MTWLIFLSISLITSSAAVLLQRYMQRDSDMNPLGFYISSATVSSMLIAVFLLFSGFDTNWDTLPIGNLLLSTVLWGGANAFVVHTLRRTEASLFSILFTTRVLWSIAIAIVFLDESFTLLNALGTLTMLVGSVVAIYERGSKWDKTGVLLSLGAGFLVGAGIANDGIVLSNGYDVPSYFLWAFLSPAVMYAITLPKARKDAIEIMKTPTLNRNVAILSLMYVVSSVTLFWAFQSGQDLAILSSLNQTQTVLIVIGAIILLGEKEKPMQKLIGSVITVIGVVLLVVG